MNDQTKDDDCYIHGPGTFPHSDGCRCEKCAPTSNLVSRLREWVSHGNTGHTLCREAADQIGAMASVGIRQEREIGRLRAALASIGEYDCPGGVHAKNCTGCAACDANEALSESSAHETTPRHLQPSYVLEQIMNNSTDPWARGVARTCLMSSSVEPARNQAAATSSGVVDVAPAPRGSLPNSLGTGGAGSHPTASSSEKAPGDRCKHGNEVAHCGRCLDSM